ncbi:MAG: hypothetical protein IRZ16_19290 [Myxococcaceae bacterium]|nr:hypothetical protein [Myxococcaceae bacterium]
MARSQADASELVHAASALEAELRRFEELCLAAEKTPLRSRKQLERAARQLEAVAESDERLGARVQALLTAIHAARARKDEHAQKVSAAALSLQERTARYQQLMQQFAELGQLAASLSAEAPEPTRLAEVSESGSLFDRMGELARRAKDLEDQAAEDAFDDVAHEADTLRQQLLSTRNKLKLLMEKHAPLQ